MSPSLPISISQPQDPKTFPQMKNLILYKYLRQIAGVLLFVILSAPNSFAQAVSQTEIGADSSAPERRIPVTSEARPAMDEDVVVLSPFEVRTDRDTGFVASSALAGGRLATDLRDTPVAYSVLTRDFIDALQLTDFTEMAQWAPNSMETPDDVNQYMGNNADGGSIRISSRGVGSNSPQKNFFPIAYNFDGYNIERLDLARGPNAVLFGASSIGGVANSVTKRARTDRMLADIRMGFGSWDNFRVTADFNVPLGRKFAIRVNGLYQDRGGWRDTESEERKAATLAATWKVFRNTEIRLEAERGKMSRSVVTNIRDYISGWDGVSTFTAITTANPAQGIDVYGAVNPVYTPSSGNVLVNYRGWARTRGGNAAAGVPAGGVTVNGPGGDTNIQNQSLLYRLNLPDTLYDHVIAASNFTLPNREYSTFSDDPIYKVNYEDITLTLNQRIGRNLFLELALNKSSDDVETDLGINRGRGMSAIYIDVNAVLPTGESNPNFLEPYAEFNSNPNLMYRDRENARIALAYVLDNTKLGSFTFNVMGGVANTKFDRNAYFYVLPLDPQPQQWANRGRIFHRYYLNKDNTRSFPKPSTWTYIDPYPATPTENTVSAILARDTASNATFNQITETDYTYLQGAINSKHFNNKLSIILAARLDSYRVRREDAISQWDYEDSWDFSARYLKPSAPTDWVTLQYRERDAYGIPFGAWMPATTRPRVANFADTRYANDRFQDDYSPPDFEETVSSVSIGAVYHALSWLSVFSNYAESFSPPTGGIKLDGSVFPASTSKGWDAGIRLTFFKGQVVGTIGYYEGTAYNGGATATIFPFRPILQAPPLEETDPGRINNYLPLLPTGYSDTQTSVTNGWEFEVTANFTKNWRLMFNAALPESHYKDRNKESLGYYQQNYDTLRQIIIEAGGRFEGDLAIYDPPSGLEADRGENAVTAWNTIQDSLKSLTSQNQRRTRLPKLNMKVFTDYTFGKGWLKGLKVGAGWIYIGRQVIGYRGADTIVDPNDPSKTIDDPTVGALDAVEVGGYSNIVLTLSYSKNYSRKVTVFYELKVDNLLDYDKPLYYDTTMRPRNGDLSTPARVATPNNYTWMTPRSVVATVRFLF